MRQIVFAVLTLCIVPVKAEEIRLDVTMDLTKGTAAIKREDFLSAIRHCKDGLDLLGTSYQDKDVVDDSGMKLIAIGIEEKKGHIKNAAEGYCRSLTERLNQYERKLAKIASSTKGASNSSIRTSPE